MMVKWKWFDFHYISYMVLSLYLNNVKICKLVMCSLPGTSTLLIKAPEVPWVPNMEPDTSQHGLDKDALVVKCTHQQYCHSSIKAWPMKMVNSKITTAIKSSDSVFVPMLSNLAFLIGGVILTIICNFVTQINISHLPGISVIMMYLISVLQISYGGHAFRF